jgi:hypothetical protein
LTGQYGRIEEDSLSHTLYRHVHLVMWDLTVDLSRRPQGLWVWQNREHILAFPYQLLRLVLVVFIFLRYSPVSPDMTG